MAVPTIISITPSVGHTGGRTLVEIVGTNFRLPTPPAAQGRVPVPPPSVRVLFGGVPARDVQVCSTTLLRVLTPIHDPSGTPATATRAAVPPSDVVVENIDDDGALIASETVTETEAFSFLRPRYDVESHLEQVVRAFMRELDRQVIDNVAWNPHTDYDPLTGGSFLDVDNADEKQRTLAYLPGIALINVRMRDSPDHTSDVDQEIDVADDTWIARRPPVPQDMTCTLVGASKNQGELLRLYSAVRLFFRKNPRLELLRDPEEPGSELIRYRMTFARNEEVEFSPRAQPSGVVTFSASVAIHGILLEEIPGAPTAGVDGLPAGLSHEATTGKGRTVDLFELDAHRR